MAIIQKTAPQIVSGQEWLRARKELLIKEGVPLFAIAGARLTPLSGIAVLVAPGV